MRLSAPKQITWIVALVLAVLGLLGVLATITFISEYAFWFAFISAVLLLLATWLKDL
jgi:L-asparagine transporter-like permease